MADQRYFLGIDVGGTKTHALIADQTGKVVGFGEVGPGNHEVVDYPGLRAALMASTHQALAQAHLRREQIAGAGFGVAGYDWPSERHPTLEAIGVLGLDCPVEAVNDTVIGLVAGAAQGWGVAVVAGTGCNCWGRDTQGRLAQVTGCDGLFGEHGGAGDLVARAVQSIAYEWCQRGPATALTPAFIKLVGASDLLDFLEGLTLGKYSLGAEAAPLVVQVAMQGDTVAREVVAWNGRELGWLAVSVIRQLDLQVSEFEVVLVGSVYEIGSMLIEPMQTVIRAEAPGARLVRLQAPPVIGGVLLGMQAAGMPVNDRAQLRSRLIESARAYMNHEKKKG